jgi:hypothetical protein
MAMTDMELEYAGNKATLIENEDGSAVIKFDDKGIGRSCGTCTLCCKLLPVKSVSKLAGQKCQHQRYGKGCMIYADRPRECRTWWCRWLSDPRTQGLSRPDRAHYVIDLEYDKIVVQDKQTGAEHSTSVLQVWIDPAFPGAHRDAGLRSYIERLNIPAIVRLNSKDGFLLVPPALNHDGDGWRELPMEMATKRDRMGVPLADSVEGA